MLVSGWEHGGKDPTSDNWVTAMHFAVCRETNRMTWDVSPSNPFPMLLLWTPNRVRKERSRRSNESEDGKAEKI